MNALDELEEIKELVNDNKKFKYKNIVNFNYDCIKDELEYADKCHSLEEQLGCPLDIVGRLLLHKEHYIYIVEKSKLTDKDFMNKHKIVGVSEFGVCILTTNCILKTEPKYYKWNEYKKTWFLKEDKSE